MIRAACLFFVISLTSVCNADEKEVRGQIREQSWTVVVRKESGQWVSKGSCTVFQDSKGQSWALGCHHVIVDATADDTLQVSISKPILENGVRVGVYDYKVELTKHSAACDLALMKVLKKGVGKRMVFGDVKPLELDTVVLHCGTFFGAYDQRISKGVIQGHNQKLESGHPLCDAGDFIVHPGSSGGGVFSEKGEYIGTVSWKHSDDCSFFVPMRTIAAFLKGTEVCAKEQSVEMLPMPKVLNKKKK